MRRYEFEAEGISPHRAVDKLLRGGVRVLSARPAKKNAVIIAVDGKDRKKVFAILKDSCYNIKNMRARGAERLREALLRGIGLVAGTAVALPAVLFVQGRVLKIDVTGSGAYLRAEVGDILSEGGVHLFSPFPEEPNSLTARILSLPRVSFCSIAAEGGVLTVCVEVGEEGDRPESLPLLAPEAGEVEELLVLRGTALVSVGDEVGRGDPVVEGFAVYGEERREVTVIARVRVRFAVRKKYETDEASARAQAALDFGETGDLRFTETEGGILAEGYGHAEAAMNFG